MKATPFSDKHYYPMSMASGTDAVLVNYDGSNFLSCNGHTHAEGHQGLILGWYKAAHKAPTGRGYYPIIAMGIQIYAHGAPAEPIFYEQTFSPEEATVTTDLDFRYGLKLRVTSFITYATSIWCERIEVLAANEKENMSLAIRAVKPDFPTRVGGFTEQILADFSAESDGSVSISYQNYGFSGKGRLIGFPAFDEVEAREGFAEGKYLKPLRAGDVYTRTAFLHGDNEGGLGCEALTELARRGYSELNREHVALWQNYFSTSSLTTGDSELDYVYRLSRYLMKAHQHPESGAITLGMQPNHWGGALSCSWDAEFSHEALLATGNLAESRHFTEQYDRQKDIGYEVMKRCGYPGIGFTGWNTLSGVFAGHTSLDEWITSFKPMFSAYAVFAVYNQWRTDPQFDAAKYKKITEDVLIFWLHRLVYLGEDGLYYLRGVRDGGECGVEADVDTFTQILFAKAFTYYGEMYSDEKYTDIGKKMLLALECNRMPDGNLSLFRGSSDVGGMIIHYHFISNDGLISQENMKREIEGMKTPFGLDNTIATEEYRHWPWNDTFALRAYVRMKESALAAERMKHATYGASSLGALPEKIRLDGCPIGYYYTSTHSLLVSALAESFALAPKRGELLIGYGFSGDSICAKCENIVVSGGHAVSLAVEDSRLTRFAVKNRSDKTLTLNVCVNPDINCGGMEKEITIPANSEFVFTA